MADHDSPILSQTGLLVVTSLHTSYLVQNHGNSIDEGFSALSATGRRFLTADYWWYLNYALRRGPEEG